MLLSTSTKFNGWMAWILSERVSLNQNLESASNNVHQFLVDKCNLSTLKKILINELSSKYILNEQKTTWYFIVSQLQCSMWNVYAGLVVHTDITLEDWTTLNLWLQASWGEGLLYLFSFSARTMSPSSSAWKQAESLPWDHRCSNFSTALSRTTSS